MFLATTTSDDPEAWVLGIVLNDPDLFDDVPLTWEDFTSGEHMRIWQAIADIRGEGGLVNAASVIDRAKVDYSTVTGLEGTFLGTGGFGARHLDQHVDTLRRRSTHRGIRGALNAIAEGVGPHLSVEDQMSAVHLALAEVTSRQRSRVHDMAEILPETMRLIDEEQSFTPTLLPSLNGVLGGLRPGALYVVGARPGVGKTLIAQNLASGLARHGWVAFSSMEMSRHELAQRFIAADANVPLGRIKNNRLHDTDRQQINAVWSDLQQSIAIDDRAGVGVEAVREHVRQVSKRGPLAGVVVDYLQLMTGDSRMPRHELVAHFSRQLKILAKEYDVPVIALSQLNRGGEGPLGPSRPKLSNLRESGAIEQDADVVMLLHRDTDEDGVLDADNMFVDIAKNRHGAPALLKLWFEGTFSRVREFPT